MEQLDVVIEMAVKTKEMNQPIDIALLNLDQLSEEVTISSCSSISLSPDVDLVVD